MKAIIIATAGLLAIGLPAYAQSPTTNATTSGTATTPGNSAGAPSAATPAGQIATTGGVSASPQAVPQSPASPLTPVPAHTADSTTTGTTTAK